MPSSSQQRPCVTRSARAKLNLALAVAPPRDDGLHPITSWMARVDLADELLVTRLEDGRLSRYAILWHSDAPQTSPIDWSITKDLAVRAHLRLEEEAGRSLPVQLKLDKRIPVGGGLGGGSADAAAMLHAVRDLFDLALSDARLRDIACELGSDVAFCLDDAPAIVEGVGEEVERTPDASAELVLVLPEVSCNTAQVYRTFDEEPAESMRDSDVRRLAREAYVDTHALFNDLAAPAMRVEPCLKEITAKVRAIAGGSPVHVTGSGSTLFVVCNDAAEASALAQSIDGALPECAAIATRLV